MNVLFLSSVNACHTTLSEATFNTSKPRYETKA
jgi:hypothetical protein